MTRGSTRLAPLALCGLVLAGCPRAKLPPPPAGTGGPVTQQLAERDARIPAVQADVVVRTKTPQHPSTKFSAIAIVAARPDRARLEVTVFGMPAATALLADGLLQVYEPVANRLTKVPIGSGDMPPAELAEFGVIPLDKLPSIFRGAVVFERGPITETALPEAETMLQVTAEGGAVVQSVQVSAGGFPLEDRRVNAVGRTFTVTYKDYGAVDSKQGPIAFPQRILVKIEDPVGPEGAMAEIASADVRLSGIVIDPKLSDDTFRLVFARPPEVHEP